MTHQQILEKAIQKAIDSGWTFFGWLDADDFKWWVEYDKEADDRYNPLTVKTDSSLGGEFGWDPSIIIFNHDFAKSLWDRAGHDWKAHLRDMVIAEDPIKYLGENI